MPSIRAPIATSRLHKSTISGSAAVDRGASAVGAASVGGAAVAALSSLEGIERVTLDGSPFGAPRPWSTPAWKTGKKRQPEGCRRFTQRVSRQCATAPLAPRPVCERTNWGRKSARSWAAAVELSVTENSQIPAKATSIENSAGYS